MLLSRLRAPSAATVIAFIALFVALSGTAVAVAPTVVNIADKTTPANVAKVSATGALTITGQTSMLAPAKPFAFAAQSFQNEALTTQIEATTATIAVTGIRVANGTSSPTVLSLYQYASTGGCDASLGGRFLGNFAVPAGQTVQQSFTTPIVLKPLAGHPDWCLASTASGTGGLAFSTAYNGYVIAGTFVTPLVAAGVRP